MDLVEEIERFVQARMEGAEPGHDLSHVNRVRRMALAIGREEGADLLVTELGALLHDVGDPKFNAGDEQDGPRLAAGALARAGASRELVDRVVEVLCYMHFPGPAVEDAARSPSLEHAVVLDADRLDAMGAIGVARAFSYGGADHRPMHNPQLVPDLTMEREEYVRSRGTTVNHFHEKLLLLKDRMLTAAGRRQAEERHAFMESFLAQFHREWS